MVGDSDCDTSVQTFSFEYQVIRSCLLDKKATELVLGTPFGTPIPPRLTAASKNEKGLYDWSTFNIR
jgi:hypothetical protein